MKKKEKNYPNNGPHRSVQSMLINGVMSPEYYTEAHLSKRDDVTPLKNVPGRSYTIDTKENKIRERNEHKAKGFRK